MRALIPTFGRLAVLVVFITAPYAVHPWWRVGALLGDATVALGVTELTARTGFVDRARHRHVMGLMVLYSAQIVLGEVISRDVAGYGLLQLLPITFAAVFFSTRWQRYALPVLASCLEYAAGRPYDVLSAGAFAVRLAALLLVAHFGARLADVLREALRVHRSLHSVLEAATEELDTMSLTQRGVEAVQTTIGWDASAVILAKGDDLEVVAFAGLGPDVVEHYRNVTLRRGDGGLADRAMASGLPQQVTDVSRVIPAEHPLLADGIRSFAGAPIRYHGESIGVLVTFHRRQRVLDSEASDRLTGVAEQLGLALGSTRAHEREAHVNAGLRELNRRKDEFLAAVSHELRTPATTIELAARTLLRAGDRLSEPERVDVQKALVSRSRELRELIESLLDLALTDSGESRLTLAPLDWTPALQRWVLELEERLGAPIGLSTPDESLVSWADSAKIERVLASLVSNAIKFSLGDPEVTVVLDFPPGAVRLVVTDHGMGILPGDVERIFDRFLQLDGSPTRAAGGLGIGLTLVRHFVLLHGGRVEVASDVGQGSSFTVTLPRLSERRR